MGAREKMLTPLGDSHSLTIPQACEFAKSLPCYVRYTSGHLALPMRQLGGNVHIWNGTCVVSSQPYPPPDQDRFVNDAVLPYLARLSCPTCATQTLHEADRRGWWPTHLSLPTVRAVRVLRYHAGSRCTLAWELAGGKSDVGIVKVTAYAAAVSHAQTLRSLAQAGFSEQSALRAPTLRAALPELGLLMMDQAPGVPFHHLEQGEWPQAARRAALWLAALATAEIALPGTYTLHNPLAVARRWNIRLQCLAPELAQDSARLLMALSAAQPPWPPVVRRIHGDFGVGHVFCAPHATTVIDWDSCRPGDPAEDAGHFLTSLAQLAMRRRASAAAITAAMSSFRATYAEALPASAAALPFYTALACLRKASRAASHSAERAGLLLRAGQAALTEPDANGYPGVSSSRGSGRGCGSSGADDGSAAPGFD